ncbi:MAG: 1-acyl-sn-glycerol-3-phosphate acyltransferase, partial [Actinomycetota bacterium]|nr:1-acyl-sn-glycerol-3-phosphate acyltransferase [Actinomycetota bacterium]
ALTIGAVPIERLRINRRSGDLVAGLIDEGWSVVIFPEGGRSPDGWAQDFRGGAAYLSIRCGRPVVPIHVQGTRRVWKKGTRLPKPTGGRLGRGAGVQVTFGRPVTPLPGEDARRMGVRVEAAIAALADEGTTDWWTATKRAAARTTPSLAGPAVGAWRRSWALDENRRRTSSAGRVWP